MLPGTKIDGLLVSSEIRERVKKAVSELKAQGITPCLATVLVGDNPASATYVKNKQKACSEVGIVTKDHKLSSDITQAELNSLVDTLNRDNEVHGILVPTILVEQHYETFKERFARFPVRIEMLSRFREPREVNAELQAWIDAARREPDQLDELEVEF